jgi:sulfate adenylyltransferase
VWFGSPNLLPKAIVSAGGARMARALARIPPSFVANRAHRLRMSLATESQLIAPHGGELVDRTGVRPAGVDALETIRLTLRELADLDMLASGALSPLTGFMGREDYERVVDEMRLAGGLPWALPVCLAVSKPPSGDRVALADATGRALAVLDVEDVYPYDREREAERCFRTTDANHPGVARLLAQHDLYVAGPVTVFDRLEPAFPELHRDPAETRALFAERGWRRVVGFQTRNPIHRAHEYLTKCALETVDGLLIHPLVGETKSDDVPAAVRVEAYRALVAGYYPEERVVVSAFPAAMRYAGPREAIWHAICRKNYGCSHFIVGRDHAGVGDYYGSYDAQLIFDEFEPHELDIEPMFFEHAFWCRACGQMATPKTCPHGGDERVFLSGTQVRGLLGRGELPPEEFTRPEVAQVLIEAYRSP